MVDCSGEMGLPPIVLGAGFGQKCPGKMRPIQFGNENSDEEDYRYLACAEICLPQRRPITV